jgi:REG-2-like HAD superfamily hydrolase
MSIRGVILDVDGTLLELRRPVSETYLSILTNHGASISNADLSAAVKAAWRECNDYYLNTAERHRTDHYREEMVWKDFIRAVLSRSNLVLESQAAARAIEEIYRAFSRAESRMLAVGAENFLSSMNKLNIPVAAATNNDQRTLHVLQELGLTQHFVGIYTCGDLGWKKPSPHFFEELARRISIPASELLHIGNNWELDVQAARVVGMQALLFGPSQGTSTVDCVSSFENLQKKLQCQ